MNNKCYWFCKSNSEIFKNSVGIVWC